MSVEGSTKGSNNSQSESSNSSPNQALILRGDSNNDITDLTLFGSPAPILLSRTGTVRKVSAVPSSKDINKDSIPINDNETINNITALNLPEVCNTNTDKYRKSLDSTYRLSLDSISEHKTKSTFSASTVYPSRECSSVDSLSSEFTDYAIRSTSTSETIITEDKTIISPGSSYLSWIESVNSEYFGNTTSATELQDVDNKVGEWNNFWLNYSNARNRYLSSPYLSTSNEDKTGDELSDAKSTSSTQREFTDKNSFEQIILSLDEINEAIKCSQRITEILQSAIKRNEVEGDDNNSKNDSYYSQVFPQSNSITKEVIIPRERSVSYVVDPQDLQKQKQLLKPTPQSSSSSCINALLSTGVADILKRVITKRRDVFSTPDDLPLASRSSFSEWSTTK